MGLKTAGRIGCIDALDNIRHRHNVYGLNGFLHLLLSLSPRFTRSVEDPSGPNADEISWRRSAGLRIPLWAMERSSENCRPGTRREIRKIILAGACCTLQREASNTLWRWFNSPVKMYRLEPSIEIVIVGSCHDIHIVKRNEKMKRKYSGKAYSRGSCHAFLLFSIRILDNCHVNVSIKCQNRLGLTAWITLCKWMTAKKPFWFPIRNKKSKPIPSCTWTFKV